MMRLFTGFNREKLKCEQDNSEECIKCYNFSNLKDEALRSVLLSKIIYCENRGINIEISVPKVINYISPNEFIIASCIDEILNNAIKLAQGCDSPCVRVNIESQSDKTKCIIENNFSENSEFLKLNYGDIETRTTKNRHSITLLEARNLLSNERNVIQNVKVEREKLIHIITIKKFYSN